MNKKIKISLLGVLLTSSLAGVATTIASCSASAIPELTIEKNPNLITELDKVLTKSLAAMKDDNLKKQEFNRWINNNELPQSAKDVISQNIVFKNGSKAVPFNDVFDKFVVSNLSGFPVIPSIPIPAIDIEIKIKEGPFVIASSSSSLLKFTTGTIGYLNPVQIIGISYDGTTNAKIKEIINTEFNKAMNAANSYQDKFALYTQWTQGENIPTGINKALYDKIQFSDVNNNIVPFNYVFDKFTIEIMGDYPVGPNVALPNMIVTPKLKVGYLIDQEILDKNLKFSDIPFTSNTGKIQLGVGFKDSTNPLLVNQLSIDLSAATTYQERKSIFDNWNNEIGDIMKPNSISLVAKEAIFSNLALNTFGYNSPLTLDQFISKISIVPVNVGDVYPNDLIANLPQMKLVLTWKKDDFSIIDGANGVEISLPDLTTNSGVGEFDFTISSRLERDISDLFTSELTGSYDENKTKYQSWNSYNSLPVSVKNALETGITFTSNIIDIPNVNTFANIIDTEKTVITKGVFPVGPTGEIEPIQIKLVLKPGRFVKIDGSSLASELPPINISNLPNAESKIYWFDEKEYPKISEFITIIENSISPTATYDQKKIIYDGYKTFENLPPTALIKLLTFHVIDSEVGQPIRLEKILESKIIFSKGTFPSVPGQPIPPIMLELKLKKYARMEGKNGIYYKILPIAINFTGLTS